MEKGYRKSGSGRTYKPEVEGRVIILKKPIKHNGKGRPVKFLVEFEGKRYSIKQFTKKYVPEMLVRNTHRSLIYKKLNPLETILLYNKIHKPVYAPSQNINISLVHVKMKLKNKTKTKSRNITKYRINRRKIVDNQFIKNRSIL